MSETGSLPPNFPPPWWDVARYEYRHQDDWKHFLVCRQCGAAILASQGYAEQHDGYHEALTKAFAELVRVINASGGTKQVLQDQLATLERSTADPPFPGHAEETRRVTNPITQPPDARP